MFEKVVVHQLPMLAERHINYFVLILNTVVCQKELIVYINYVIVAFQN